MSNENKPQETERLDLLDATVDDAAHAVGALIESKTGAKPTIKQLEQLNEALYPAIEQIIPLNVSPKPTGSRDNLLALMKKHSDYGARDSEGLYALERVEEAARDGKPFPLVVKEWPHDNPFELYDSVAGWQTASAELVQAAEAYWKALVQTRLKITIL